MSTARLAVRLAAGSLATLVLGAVVGPALALRSAGERGGLPTAVTADVLAVSVAVGAVAAVLTWRRVLTGDLPVPVRCSAALAGLGVLAPLAAAVPALALHTAARLPADVATGAWLVPGLWGGSLLTAVVAADGVHLAARRWLARTPRPRGSDPGPRRRTPSRSG